MTTGKFIPNFIKSFETKIRSVILCLQNRKKISLLMVLLTRRKKEKGAKQSFVIRQKSPFAMLVPFSFQQKLEQFIRR